MIQPFADKHTEALWQGKRHKIPPDIAHRALNKLQRIHASPDLDTLRNPPSNNLEILSGDRAGQYSIRINQRYRICFAWDAANNAYDVEITDYH
ncbi:MAG: type II toxin-antitoxin system RelE/ParE family toxin [Puniceicoccales bacterium]|nr:type II toxin-antitoxin system RelE/ParE family toxin [Puniceicoccales bacterium]